MFRFSEILHCPKWQVNPENEALHSFEMFLTTDQLTRVMPQATLVFNNVFISPSAPRFIYNMT